MAAKMSFSFCISFFLVIFLVFHKTALSSPLDRKSYDGYKVLEIKPQNEKDVEFLRQLMSADDNLYFGTRPSSPARPVELMVPPTQLTRVEELLNDANIPYTIKLQDVQLFLNPLWEKIDSHTASQTQAGRVFELDKFNTLNDIDVWMNSLANQCRSGLTCQVVSLGNSFENRAIKVFRISKTGENRKGFYIDAATRSSDWISTSTAVNILNALARGLNADAVRLTNDYDWHIVPVVNPDGYEYTFKSDRFWKKNRRPQGACFGTDLNHNFEYEWGYEAASHSPCSNQFCGIGPGSEPETQVIQAELRNRAATLRGVFSLHAVGNTWEFPWGFTVGHEGAICYTTADNNRMSRVAEAAAVAAGEAQGTTWRHGTVCNTSGPTSGGVYDFAKATAGVTYSFYVGLRGESFVVETSEIQPAFIEAWAGLLASVDKIAETN